MLRRVNGWLILAGVSSTALLAACAQIAPVVLPRLAERTAPASLSVQITPVPIIDATAETSAATLRATAALRADSKSTQAARNRLPPRRVPIKRKRAGVAEARDEAPARRDVANQQRIADATAKAQEQLRLAQVNLDKVKAGAPSTER